MTSLGLSEAKNEEKVKKEFVFFLWSGHKQICLLFVVPQTKLKKNISNFLNLFLRSCDKKNKNFGIGLIKTYLIGSIVQVFENQKNAIDSKMLLKTCFH